MDLRSRVLADVARGRGRKDCAINRIVRKIEFGEGCWAWTATTNGGGYGRISLFGVPHQAHRVLYELLVGPIPDGMQLDHLCRNRACVRPSHLEPVTQRENLLRGVGFSAVNAAKTHCIHDHELTAANTIVDKRNGWRKCRECRNARRRVHA